MASHAAYSTGSYRQSIAGPFSSSSNSPALQARINEKKAELANLKQLRELSAELADSMQKLHEKLATLSDGTEAVATVLANWHNVMRSINMGSVGLSDTATTEEEPPRTEDGVPLPHMLVRIPNQPDDP